jgi:23S rRNA (cytidine1920-2'-O)/16S rRNA (cytidine1409-2'-O)-methyltransferase
MTLGRPSLLKSQQAPCRFQIDVRGLVCADVGASTGTSPTPAERRGAFTPSMLARVSCWKLRQDERVIVMEGTNARFVERLPEPVELVTIDASFISLKILLPVVSDWFASHSPSGDKEHHRIGDVVALIKPQFEARRKAVTAGG